MMDWVTFVGVLFTSAAALVCLSVFNLRRQQHLVKQQHSRDQSEEQQPTLASLPAKKAALYAKHRSFAAERNLHKLHKLELNTLKGHSDAVTGLSFSSNGRSLATACGDGVVRVVKLENASSKNLKVMRINIPSGRTPTDVVFGDDESKLVVASRSISGAELLMYGSIDGRGADVAKQQGKLAPPEIKWENKNVHDSKDILTLVNSTATHGTGDGSVIVASCSEGTDIKLWLAKTGKFLGSVDTNQLKNTMAALSPDGRFLSAAAFTADVKIWEIVYGRDGQVRELVKVMQLKGHKSAVTWLCFTWDSQQIITASKDGSIRIWNMNVRYHLQEDPKCLKVFSIPLLNEKGAPTQYDRLAVSPDNSILAVTKGSTLQWLSAETGTVLDTAHGAHDGDITALAWAPQLVPTERGMATILATASSDRKVRLWYPPSL